MPLESKNLGVDPVTIGHAEMTVVSLGDTTVTREILAPGWRWSLDIKPIVKTDLCRAFHQVYIASGRLHVLMEDGAELELERGDAGVIPPGHDAWVVGDEPCEVIDFSPTYSQLIEAGSAYDDAITSGKAKSRAQAAALLRADVRASRLDASAVEIVLGAIGHRPGKRQSGPSGLTRREIEVLVLIATGASTKQAAYVLGIAPKTAAAHVEHIYTKVGVSTRADATRFAIQHRLVDPVAPVGS